MPVLSSIFIDAKYRLVALHKIKWCGKVYPVLEAGKYWPSQPGRNMIHQFTVNVGPLDMCAAIDSFTFVAKLGYLSDPLAE